MNAGMSTTTTPKQTAILLAGLRSIARGDWNGGREPSKDMTAREYAVAVLRDAGIAVRG